MNELVQVPVPVELYPAVIKLVSEYLADGGKLVHPDAQTWEDVLQGDSVDARVAMGWWDWLRPQEKEMFRWLARLDINEVEASDLAEGLGISPSELAGVLGPFQRRMAKDVFPVALTSRTVSVDGRRVKVLRLAEGLREIILGVDHDGPPSKTASTRTVPKDLPSSRLKELRRQKAQQR